MGTGDINVIFDEKTSMMTVTNKENQIILKETAPIQYKEGSTIQTLGTDENEYFYGGGTQNGRFSHKGEKIDIVNSNNWVNGGVASPNPFYWSTKGYGVVRNIGSQKLMILQVMNKSQQRTMKNVLMHISLLIQHQKKF